MGSLGIMDSTISVYLIMAVFITISPRTLLASVTQQPIATVSEISLQDCYRECNTRLSCQSIGYNRRALFCQIYSQPWVTGSTQCEAGVVRKNVGETPELTTTKQCSSTSCTGLQNCMADCGIRECLQPSYSSGMTVKGNMGNVDSKIAFVCDNFFTAVYSTCTNAGTWSKVEPECIIYDYEYAGENTAGYEAAGSFSLQNTFIDACLKRCNETLDCVGVNYFPVNKSCISTEKAQMKNATNSHFYFYSKLPIELRMKNGIRYAFTRTEGREFCESIGSTIASFSDLKRAYKFGFSLCQCGWIDNGDPYLVIQERCGWRQSGVSYCWKANTFDVFCKNKEFRKDT